MLRSEDINVYHTDMGEEGVDLGKLYDYDLIILEVDQLNDHLSGFDVINQLRLARVETPIMVLTIIKDIDAKVRALGFGADAYLTKPCNKDSLIAEIKAVVRRSKGHAHSIIKTGNIEVNLDTKTVSVNGERIHLTGKEYQMMELLSLRKGTTLTREMFLNHLYGGMDEPELKIIDIFIHKIRGKFREANLGIHHIETVWGRGYRLSDEPCFSRGLSPAREQNAPSYTDQQRQTELDALHKQRATLFAELGLEEGSTIEDAMAQIRRIKLNAESMLNGTHANDVTLSANDLAVGASSDFKEASKLKLPAFDEHGLRLPIGSVFLIGSLIEVDTNECLAANIQTGHVVKFPPVVGAVLEVLSYYQGRLVNGQNLIDYLFETPAQANATKLGMYISQAQGVLTQLVGRELAAMFIQVLSGGGYGMAKVDHQLESGRGKMLALPAPRPSSNQSK